MRVKPKLLLLLVSLASLGLSSCLTTYVIAMDAAKNKIEKEVDSVFANLTKSDHPDFQNTEVPEEMENYSAVLLNRYVIYKYENRNLGVCTYEAVRMRLKLQDKSALEEFSEFYYPEEAEASFKIIKPDGSEVSIDPEEAVRVEESGGGSEGLFFWSRSGSAYNKMALPGLEVGDIIDFAFIGSDNPFNTSSRYLWPQVNIRLVGSYPAVQQKIDLTIGKDFYVNTISLNGAPKFKKVPHRKDFDYSPKLQKHATRYLLEDGERLPIKGQYWTSSFLVQPIVRFQASTVYGGKGNYKTAQDKIPYFYHMPQRLQEEVKRSKARLTISKVLDNSYLYSSYSPSKADIKFIEKELKPRSQVDRAKIAYYYLRTQLYSDIIGEEGYSDEISIQKLDDRRLEWYEFYHVYKGYLDKLNVNHSVVAFVPRTFGPFDNLLSFGDFSLVFVIKDRNDTYVVRNPTFYSNFGSPYYSFDHADYETISGRRISLDFDKYSSTHEDNFSQYKMEVALSEDNEALTISREVEHMGYNRLRDWHDVVSLEDYYHKDLEMMRLDPPEQKTKRSKWISKIESDRAQVFEKLRKEQQEMHLSDIESILDIDLEEVDDFELLSDGRYEDEPALRYRDAFTTDAFLQHVGSNYVLNVGSLIGSQIELEEEDMERTTDVYLAYPHTLNHEIKIAVPQGYTVEGLDALNLQVENETGGFVSNTTLEDDHLIVSVKKYYKNYTQPAENWPLMVDFLEAAYEFTQKKVVLKKVAG